MIETSEGDRRLLLDLEKLVASLSKYAHALQALCDSGPRAARFVQRAIPPVIRAYDEADRELTRFQLHEFDQWARRIGGTSPWRAASSRAAQLSKTHTRAEYKLLLAIAFLDTKITIFFLTILLLVQQLVVRDLALPPSISRLRRSRNLERVTLGIGGILTLLAFVKLSPLAALITAVVGLALFLVERFLLAGRTAPGMAFPRKVAHEAESALNELRTRIEMLQRLLAGLSRNLPSWPEELDECLNRIERGEALADAELKRFEGLTQQFLDRFGDARDTALRSVGLLAPPGSNSPGKTRGESARTEANPTAASSR